MNILIIDDDDVDLMAIRKVLQKKYCVLEAKTAKEGLEKAKKEKIDCIVLDYLLPDSTGLEFVKEIAETSSIPIIAVTGMGNEKIAVELMKAGVEDYLMKKDVSQLSNVIENVFSKKNVSIQNISDITDKVKKKIKNLNDSF